MSKAAIVLALAAACVGLVGASYKSPIRTGGSLEEVVEIEPAVHSHSGGAGGGLGSMAGLFGRLSPFGHISDEALIEEMRFRGISRGCGCGFGGHSGHSGHSGYGGYGGYGGQGGHGDHAGSIQISGPPLYRRRPIGIRPKPLFQHHHMFSEGLGGGISKGGFGGGIKGSGGSSGGATRHAGSKEVAKGALVAGKNNFEIDALEAGHAENEGVHKHQVIEGDKTIIKNHVTGINDVDSFKNSVGGVEAGHISGGSSHLAAEGGIAKEAEHELGGGHEEHITGGDAFADI